MVSSGLKPIVLLMGFVVSFSSCFAEGENTGIQVNDVVVQQEAVVVCPVVTQDLAQFEPIAPVTAIDVVPDVVAAQEVAPVVQEVMPEAKNEDNGNFNGDTTITNKIFGTLSILGAAKLFEVVVAHDAEIFGSCASVNSNFNMLRIHGSADIKNAIIAGNCEITGSAKIKNAAITGDLILNDVAAISKTTVQKITISASRLTMSDTTASSLVVQKKGKGKGKQLIRMNGGVITGDVVFEGGNGRVILKKGAEIKGTITGGVAVVQ